MPLAAASFLKSSSHAPKLLVPQGGAATAGAVDIIRTALNNMGLDRNLKLILRNVSGNRGQNKAVVRLIVLVVVHQTAGREFDQRFNDRSFSGWAIRRFCGAMETGWPGNPPPNAARVSGGEA